MSNKYKVKKPKQEVQLTPEQQQQKASEEKMRKFIEEEGLEAMVNKQRDWKLNDMYAKIAAASNVKAWFETAYELVDARDKGLLDLGDCPIEVAVDRYNDFKISLYKEIAKVYEGIDISAFGAEGEDFVNPFAELWSKYENQRDSVEKALEELYAWTIFEDPVLWASGINQMVVQENKQKEFKEEEAE